MTQPEPRWRGSTCTPRCGLSATVCASGRWRLAESALMRSSVLFNVCLKEMAIRWSILAFTLHRCSDLMDQQSEAPRA